MGNDRETQSREEIKALAVRFKRLAVAELNVENNDVEFARGGNFAVHLAQRAGGGVAGVGKELFARDLALRVELGESLVRHIDLAAHDEAAGRVWQLLRQRADGFEVFGHVFAGDAVAARRAASEFPVEVFHRNGESVDLRLDGPDGFFAQRLVRVREKGVELVKGKDVPKTLQRHGVGHR